jgi:hypothetical protein
VIRRVCIPVEGTGRRTYSQRLLVPEQPSDDGAEELGGEHRPLSSDGRSAYVSAAACFRPLFVSIALVCV